MTRSLSQKARNRLRAATAATGLLFAFYAAHLALGVDLGIGGLLDDWLDSVLLAACAGLVLARGLVVPRERAPWLVAGTAMALWTAGNVYWVLALEPRGDSAPYPSPADALWLLFYPMAYVTLVLLARARTPVFRRSTWLDGMVGALGLAAVGAAPVLGMVQGHLGGGLSEVATNLTYPLADLLLGGAAVGVFALSAWRPGRAWLLIGGAFALLAAADSAFLYTTVKGTYYSGSPIDFLWPAGMALLALAAWQAPDGRAIEYEGRRVLVVPALFSVAAVAVLVYGNFAGVNVVALALSVAAVLSAIVRTAFSFKEVQALAESRKQAHTDELTGLANRRFLWRELDRLLAGDAPFAFLLLDLDHFKEVNDTLGHSAGDLLLQQIAPRLSGVLRSSDTLARVGGDEFGLLLPAQSSGETALRIARRLVGALERPFEINGLRVHTAASVGVALYPRHGADADGLMRAADMAMYRAKRNGTGGEVHGSEREVESRDGLTLSGELARAIRQGGLVVHYQPQALLRSGRITGVEALVRWRHARHGMLPPGDFIPLAEQTGLMPALTRSVLDTAARDWRRWLARGFELTVSVNLAPSSLSDMHLPEDVLRALERHRMPASFLRLEITEDVLPGDPERVLGVLTRLRELGVEITLDDFGTGSSSLSRLKRLPVDELKIDRSFVMRMDEDPADAAIVHSLIDLAHRLDVRVAAEGVETETTWRRLGKLGCELAQGFLLSHPVPSAELVRRLEGLAADAPQAAGSARVARLGSADDLPGVSAA